MQAVIMAGGKGTRLSSVTKDEIPKPMVRLCGKPILEYQIECLKRNGIQEFFLVVGYLGGKIEEYFGDGERWGIHIAYIREEVPLGTAGAMFYLKDKVQGDFLLVLGDLVFDIFLERFYQFHKGRQAEASLLVHPNTHPYDSDIIILDADGRAVACDPKGNVRNYDYKNIVNAGIYILSPSILDKVGRPQRLDLEKDILFPMIVGEGRVYGYQSSEYVRDVGTPDRLRSVEDDIRKQIVSEKNLGKKQRCIFLDRDGTVNKYVGLLKKPGELELEELAGEAIAKINQSEYLAIVVTNQPVVARGMCTLEDVEDIHKRLETLLGERHAYVDDVRLCPHHPDKGYPGENPSYKIECNCRKPRTGMLLDCAREYNIDLGASWIIGDTTVDIQTGKNAGMRTVLVRSGLAGGDRKYDAVPDKVCGSLMEAVTYIIEGKGEA